MKLLLGIALLTALLFYGAVAVSQTLNSSSNMSAAINSTQQYLNQVNQSAYVVFYPNLQLAYSYLSLAKNQSTTNATYAYSLLAKARQSAQNQETNISQYRRISLYVIATLGIALGIILYLFMIPYKRKK